MYIRDPEGVYGAEFRDRLDLHATLPPDVRRSGYRVGQIELYLAPSDQDDAIYVVAPPGAERWPRVHVVAALELWVLRDPEAVRVGTADAAVGGGVHPDRIA